MEFEPLPTVWTGGLYDEALGRYVRLVGQRALAIYQIGSVRFPGLSDIDLLVVPDRARRDNGAWFSPFVRLPRSLQEPYLHGPCILPADDIEAISFTTHGRRRLLHGDDVIGSCSMEATPEQHWALLLEAYCSYQTYISRRRRKGRAPARHMIAVASSLRFTLDCADRLRDTRLAPEYAAAIDALRAGFVAGRSEGPAVARGIWHAFERAFEDLDRGLDGWLPLEPDEHATEFALAFLHGRRGLPGLDEERSRQRRLVVARHQESVRRLGFRYGDLFYREPYLHRLRRLDGRRRPRALIDLAWHEFYRLRRRIRERRSPAP